MPKHRPLPIAAATDGPLVVLLVYDGLCLFEFGCAFEIFGLTRPEMGAGWYRCRTAAAEPGPLRSQAALVPVADGGLELLAAADIIVIPGWRGVDAPAPAALCAALRQAHDRGARIVSICGGAFVLAASGLLAGRRATTHWRHTDRLAAAYPDITVEAAALYVEDGRLLTSAGSAAGLDLCLHVVRSDFGAPAANRVARRLVLAAHRNGDQSQFIDRPLPPPAGHRLSGLLDQIRQRLDEAWTIERMAAEARVSLRTVQRHIQAATGLPPGVWLLHTRLAAARDWLEQTSLSIDTIARHSGLGSATNFRRHFRAATGLSPTAYRASFSHRPGLNQAPK